MEELIQSRPELKLQLSKGVLKSLKACPLCGAINARQNAECFVCRWHGSFDHDPVRVETAVRQLVHSCPELLDLVLYMPRSRPTLWGRMRNWVFRVFGRGRRLDLTV
jgi:hypothetical protein